MICCGLLSKLVLIVKSSNLQRTQIAVMRQILLLLSFCIIILSCTPQDKDSDSKWIDSFTTPMGKVYEISEPSDQMMENYNLAKADFEANPNDIDAIIWYGRRTAYLGQYPEAIQIYSDGIAKFPDEPRLYRHRGHRYISVREFDKAIADLSKAAELIQGTKNEVEPDGMPNAMNIPVSSLHGNIYYHLGLAHYLKGQMEQAYTAYLKCRDSGSRYDNIVSSTHWLYMIQRRLGNTELADSMLSPITLDSAVIENHSYRDLCNMYSGLVPLDSIFTSGPDSPSNDAVKYGVANWYLYNGDSTKAKEMMNEIIDGSAFSSFGYIAAEADILSQF